MKIVIFALFIVSLVGCISRVQPTTPPFKPPAVVMPPALSVPTINIMEGVRA